MQLKLPPQTVSKLRAQRDALAPALAKAQSFTASIEADEKAIAELPDEIERAEARVDPSDEKALLEIAKNRVKHTALENRAAGLRRQAKASDKDLRRELNIVKEVVESALGPICASAQGRIAKHLSVVMDEDQARALAPSTAAFQTLVRFGSCSFSGIVDPAIATAEAIRVVDVLLSGELKFIRLP